MRIVTAITPQVKNAKRCNIFLDGEFFCGLSLETVMKNRLKVGAAVDERTLEKIQLDSERSAAMDKAMTYLSGAVKSEKQTRDYLKEKGYVPLVINYVLEKLKEYGFVDDGDFARRYAETYAEKKGAFLIKKELKTKGIADEISEEALSALGSQSEAAARIAEKYMRGKEADLKTVQKLYRHLLSKGFSYDDAKAAVEAIRSSNED
ncbi:MAG: RecX family transcriptional regulator [Clostridia bacterium]|nr:RecX family transcriptional regulator [Clostridia bacterium]